VRPKARGLVQHGGPPGRLEESDPAGVMVGPYPPAFSILYRLPGQELPSCELMEFPAAVI
jgi:hypothetical protein